MNWTEQAITKLREQQSKVKARSAQWMVAKQLMDICRHEPASAELIAQDLDNPELSIEKAERQIKALADKNKQGSFSCVTPAEADEVLRKFYGLATPGGAIELEPESDTGFLNLADFLG